MSLEPCTFSLDTAGACLQTSFLAIDQLPLLNGMLTPAKSCENEPLMDGFPACECMKGTLACLIHPSTPEAWTLFMRDSLARTLALLESRQAYLREPDQVFTVKSCASLAWYDQSSCSWKTYQRSLVTDWEPFSETWPRWGMTAGGAAYAHPMSERRMGGIDGGLGQFSTPAAQDANPYTGGNLYQTDSGTVRSMNTSGKSSNRGLQAQVMWATPNTMDSLPSRSYEAMKRQATTGGRKNRSRPGNLREQIDPLMCQAYDDAKLEANGMKFATPQTRDYRSGQSSRWDDPARSRNLNDQVATPVSGKLNPDWVAWLMGWPLAWCETKDFKAGGKKNPKLEGQPI